MTLQRAATESWKRRAVRIAIPLISRVVWTVAPFASLVGVWQLVYMSGAVPRIWLPSPSTTWAAFASVVASGQYQEDIAATLGRLLVGYAMGAGTGVILGLFLGVYRGVGEFVDPVLTFLNAIAGIVWIPLAIMWFGLGTPTVLFLVWNAVFFLVLLNTMRGVATVPAVYEQSLRTLGASTREVILQVLLPGALPNIVTGLRVGMGFGWRAVIAAEIFVASEGIGYLIYNAGYYYRSDLIIVGLVTVGAIWLLMDRIVLVPFEDWTIRQWGLVTSA